MKRQKITDVARSGKKIEFAKAIKIPSASNFKKGVK